MDAVNPVLIKSPIPVITHVPCLNWAAPLPTYEALATTAIANGVILNFIAINAPISAGTVNWMAWTTPNKVLKIGWYCIKYLKISPKIAFGTSPATIPIATPDKTLKIKSFGPSIFFIVDIS